MGGVDLADMLVSLYRIPLRTKRYYLRIFAYLIDLCICNAWLLARRDAKLLSEKYGKSLKQLKKEVATTLYHQGTTLKRGRPSLDDVAAAPPPKHHPVAARPQDDVRYDQTGHWPVCAEKA